VQLCPHLIVHVDGRDQRVQIRQERDIEALACFIDSESSILK